MNGKDEDDAALFDSLSYELSVATLKKIKKFEEIRGKKSDIPFWDVVVLSALDDPQKKAFEHQLREKLARSELPLAPEYIVVHDPVGAKVGNGGGVIAALDELKKIYHEKINDLKILILLSGGYSQRLPSASLLGKIFTTLPMGKNLLATFFFYVHCIDLFHAPQDCIMGSQDEVLSVGSKYHMLFEQTA